jgi:3D (Asp-Asp-Asp) domain-containing protein/peptidoglycan hydrolase CwlO-like protein
VAADSSTTLHTRASRLQQANVDLAARAHGAILDVYALDSQLARGRARVVDLRLRIAQVRAARTEAVHGLAVAHRSLAAAQRALALRLQEIYEQGGDDSIQVVLGASSVEQALNSLDALDRVADSDRLVIEQTRRARDRYRAEARALASRERTLTSLAEDAAAETRGIEQARAERAAYLGKLTATRRLNATALSALERKAQEIQMQARQLTEISTPGGTGGSSHGMLTVSATAYSLPGHTSSGAPVGWGVVAVDPGVIPLGTRMTIPGYGEGIAADTGAAVVGNSIDVWFPTLRQAQAWGRRTVTITLHG